mmetsp:Transcript_75600/g.231361  ORF Transcript_75600/g.231361 Transcript_75600/m.231361 type:complete len:265 (+) Transcript_75600:367-1161(+)
MPAWLGLEDCVAGQSADEEAARLDGAGNLVLLRRHHVGTQGLRRHVIESFAETPDQDARQEAQEQFLLRGEYANINPQGGSGNPQADEEAAADAVGDCHSPVADHAEDRIEQDRRAVYQLGEAHEQRLLLPPQVLALHGQQVRHPRGAQEARVKAVRRQCHEAKHGPPLQRFVCGRQCSLAGKRRKLLRILLAVWAGTALRLLFERLPNEERDALMRVLHAEDSEHDANQEDRHSDQTIDRQVRDRLLDRFGYVGDVPHVRGDG